MLEPVLSLFSLAPFHGLVTLDEQAGLGHMTQNAGPLWEAEASFTLGPLVCTQPVWSELRVSGHTDDRLPQSVNTQLGLPRAGLMGTFPVRAENGKGSPGRAGRVPGHTLWHHRL